MKRDWCSVASVGLAAIWCLCSPGTARANMVINLVAGANLSANADALAAFQRAANTWEKLFTDPITINLDVDLQDMNSGSILGSTNTRDLFASYSTVVSALRANAAGTSIADIENALPDAPLFTAPSNISVASTLIGSKADFKALGFQGLDSLFGASDGTITFNSGFAFDYDNRDGVGAGLIDFESVATHEIGHALGFYSSVDTVDEVGSAAFTVSPTILDLFRFASNNVPSTLAAFKTTPRTLSPGGTQVFTDTTVSYLLSTGFNLGDGNQASHWKADEKTGTYIGVMDPTLAYGQIDLVTPADIRALQLIGYDVVTVPEPGTWLLGAAGFALLVWRGRRPSTQRAE